MKFIITDIRQSSYAKTEERVTRQFHSKIIQEKVEQV